MDMPRSNRITSHERSRAPSASRVSTNHHIFSLNNGTYHDATETSPLLKATVAEAMGPSRELKTTLQRRVPVASPTVVLAQHANLRNPPFRKTMSIPPPNNLYRGATTNRSLSSSIRPPHIPAHNSAPPPRPPVPSPNPPVDVISAIEGWGAPVTPLPNNASGRAWQPTHAQSAQPPRTRARSQLPRPHTVMLDTPVVLPTPQIPVPAPEPPHTAPPPPRTRSRSAARAQSPAPTAHAHTTRPLTPTHRLHTPTARARTPAQRARTHTARAAAPNAPPPPTSAPASASTSLVTALAAVANIDAVRARFSESMEQLQRRRELAYRRAREERQQVLQRELALQQARERAAQEEAERRVRAEKERARQELVRERERRVALELARRESVRALGERAQTGLVLREEVRAEEEALQRAEAEVAALQLSLAEEERRVVWEEAVGAEREWERWLRSVQHEGRRVAASAVKAGAEAEREDAVLALALKGERRRVEAEVRRLAMARAGGGALCVYTDVLQRVGGDELHEDELDVLETEAEVEAGRERVKWTRTDEESTLQLLHRPASPVEAHGDAYSATHGESEQHSLAHLYTAHTHHHAARLTQHYAAEVPEEADDTQAVQDGHADEEDEEAAWLFSLVDAEDADDAVEHTGAVEATAPGSSAVVLPSHNLPLDAPTAVYTASAPASRSLARAGTRKPATSGKSEKSVARAWDAKPCKGAAWDTLACDTRDAPPRPTHTAQHAPSPSLPSSSSSSRSRTRSCTRSARDQYKSSVSSIARVLPVSSRQHDYSRPPPPPSALPLPASSLLLHPDHHSRENTWQRVAGDAAVAARVAAPFDSVVLSDGSVRPVSALHSDDVHALATMSEPPLPALPAPPLIALEYAAPAATERTVENRRAHSAARTRSFTPSRRASTHTPVSVPAPSPRSQTPRAVQRAPRPASPRRGTVDATGALSPRGRGADKHRSASASSPRPSAAFLASPRPGTRAPAVSSARAAPAAAPSSVRTVPPTPTQTHTPAHMPVSARSSAPRRALATPTSRLRAAATQTSDGCAAQDTLTNTLANTSSGAAVLLAHANSVDPEQVADAEERDQAWGDEKEEEGETCVAPSPEAEEGMGILSCVGVVPHGHHDACPYDDADDADGSASGTLPLSFAAQPALPLHTAEDAPAAPAQGQMQVLLQGDMETEAMSQAAPDVLAVPQLPLPPLPSLPPVTPTRLPPTSVLASPSPSPPSPTARRTPPPCAQPSPSSLSLAYCSPLPAHAPPHLTFTVSASATVLALARADVVPLPHPPPSASPKHASPPRSPLGVSRARAVLPRAPPVCGPLSPQHQRQSVESLPVTALTPVHAHTHTRVHGVEIRDTSASLALATGAQRHTQPLRRGQQQRADATLYGQALPAAPRPPHAVDNKISPEIVNSLERSKLPTTSESFSVQSSQALLTNPTQTAPAAPAPAQFVSFTLPAPGRLSTLPEHSMLAHSPAASPTFTASTASPASSPQHLFCLGDISSCPPSAQHSPHSPPAPAPATPIARSVASFHDELRRGINVLRASVLSPPRSLHSEQDDG